MIIACSYSLQFKFIPPISHFHPFAPAFYHQDPGSFWVWSERGFIPYYNWGDRGSTSWIHREGFPFMLFSNWKKIYGLSPFLDLRKFLFPHVISNFYNPFLFPSGLVCHSGFKMCISIFHYGHITENICFIAGEDHFQYKFLPFGLSTALRVFTKCLSVIPVYFRKLEIYVYPCLDDWLIKLLSKEEILLHIK